MSFLNQLYLSINDVLISAYIILTELTVISHNASIMATHNKGYMR